ncbi:predicted protein [Sclerotinia sclerotiorum 1980 UF-70]|uniref:Uncharacterized protein n=1 Tax=Sclerotinia sclerotiorum (strain ATCC 18683 / 1980 / Ss-1) TaxID=665079 RepID=A7F9A1_SCLS1|nr:predicted protein [Sclerotinia sclerotiorum 1980 UF-70]EDO00312.1 predicted protein [Sclerotinia sclerotiorum 1980 UF-70]
MFNLGPVTFRLWENRAFLEHDPRSLIVNTSEIEAQVFQNHQASNQIFEDESMSLEVLI